MIESLQRVIMFACLAGLAGGALAWLLCFAFPRLRRLLSTCEMAVVFGVAVYVGGAKSIMSKTGHDDAHPYNTVVSAEVFSGEAVTNVPGYEVRCQYPYGTNGFAVILGFSPGIPDSDILSRFWFRDSDREDWTSLLSFLDGAQNTWIDVGATNYFVCISEVTNRFSHAQYWFGDDLPAKVVEGGGGIEIVSITPSATNVTVRYAVEASAIYDNPDFGGIGSITAAIDGLHRVGAGEDVDQGPFVDDIRWSIVRLIAAAEHLVDGVCSIIGCISSQIGWRVCCLIDVDRDIVLRRAVEIVTPIDGTL